jgi:hypothetical protein
MKTLPLAPHTNPAAETIHLGPLTINFLITRETSGGSIAAFELIVPGETSNNAGIGLRRVKEACAKLGIKDL